MYEIDKGYSTFKLKLGISVKNNNNSGNGRRSGKDRRKTSPKQYFIGGGLERRNWKERRNYWYITM
jgi:hypothetical protein